MPKIPESSAIQQPRAAVPGMIPEMLGQRTIQNTLEQGFSLLEKYKQQQQQAEVVKLSGDLERGLTDIQLEIERDPNIKTAADASRIYMERAKPLIEGTTAQGNWKSVQAAVGARGAGSALRGMTAVSRVGYAREVDAARAAFDENAMTYAKGYAVAESDADRATAMGHFYADLEVSDLIGEEEKGKRRRAFDEDRIKQRTIHLTNQGRFGEARDYLKGEEAQSVLDSTDTLALNRTIDIVETHQETQRKHASTAAEKVRISTMLGRIYNPEDPRDIPSIPEILDADLPRIVTEHFIELVTKKARGEDIDYLDANVVNNLYIQVRSGEITEFSQMSGMIGNGLPIEEAEKLMGIIEKRRKDPSQKALDKRIEKFLAAYAGPIAGKFTIMGMPDPMGGPQNYAFRIEVERRVNEAIEKGEDPYRLLTYGTKEYLGPLHFNFRRTLDEMIADEERALMLEEAETGTAAPQQPPTKSFEDFVKEQGK